MGMYWLLHLKSCSLKPAKRSLFPQHRSGFLNHSVSSTTPCHLPGTCPVTQTTAAALRFKLTLLRNCSVYTLVLLRCKQANPQDSEIREGDALWTALRLDPAPTAVTNEAFLHFSGNRTRHQGLCLKPTEISGSLCDNFTGSMIRLFGTSPCQCRVTWGTALGVDLLGREWGRAISPAAATKQLC